LREVKEIIWPYSRLKSAIAIGLFIALVARLFVLQVKVWPVMPKLEAMISLDYISVNSHEKCMSPDTKASMRKEIKEEAPTVAWLVSPGYWALGTLACRDGEVKIAKLIKWNQWFTIGTAFVAALFVRFLTSSWLLGMFAAFSILTRSSILSRQGLLAVDAPMMFFVMTWFCGFAHYVRTGSIFSVGVGFVSLALAVFFDRAALALGLSIPVLMLGAWALRFILVEGVIARLKADDLLYKQKALILEKRNFISQWFMNLLPSQQSSWDFISRVKTGGTLSTLRVPFAYWAYQKSRWLRLTLAWLGLTIVLAFIFTSVEWQFLGIPRERLKLDLLVPLINNIQMAHSENWVVWLVEVLEPLDFRLLMALSVIIVCAVHSPAEGLPGFLEVSILFLISLVGLCIASWVSDCLDSRLLSELGSYSTWSMLPSNLPIRRFFGWIEPTLISLGIGGIYNLIIIASKHSERAIKK
jgi:hypothetical protein